MIRDTLTRGSSRALRRMAALFIQAASRIESTPVLLPPERDILQRNGKFRDAFIGKRAFVIGNGPSLNHHDLHLLRDEIVFAVNGFACHPIVDHWRPYALCLADPAYFRRSDVYIHEFEQMRSRLPETLFFAPLIARNTILKNTLLPERSTFYCSLNGNLADYKHFELDLTAPLPGVQTVSLLAIMVALYAGCDPVYLIGMDHDFLASPKTQTHFSPDYESAAARAGADQYLFTSWSYLNLTNAVAQMFRGYYNLHSVARSRGQHIFNATHGGFLDVFPRRDFAALF